MRPNAVVVSFRLVGYNFRIHRYSIPGKYDGLISEIHISRDVVLTLSPAQIYEDNVNICEGYLFTCIKVRLF